MNANERELIYKEETYRIVGSAMTVSGALGCGFLEAVYQEAMEIELKESRVPFEAQKRIQIHYKDRILQKEYVADFLCYDRIIVEIKAIKKITEIASRRLLDKSSINKTKNAVPRIKKIEGSTICDNFKIS